MDKTIQRTVDFLLESRTKRNKEIVNNLLVELVALDKTLMNESDINYLTEVFNFTIREGTKIINYLTQAKEKQEEIELKEPNANVNIFINGTPSSKEQTQRFTKEVLDDVAMMKRILIKLEKNTYQNRN